MTAVSPTPENNVEIFPVAIGQYEDFEDLDVDAQIGRFIDLIAAYGPQLRPWSAPPGSRNADEVIQRLRQWTRSSDLEGPVDSILYWVGHGWSDGTHASLAVSNSPRRVGLINGITPAHMADAIRVRQASERVRAAWKQGHGWTIVIVDACRSAQFIKLVLAAIELDPSPPNGVMLIGTSGDGGATLGRFTRALHVALRISYRAGDTVKVRDLGTQLSRLLPLGSVVETVGDMNDSVLTQTLLSAGSQVSGALDVVQHLEDVLAGLGPDERHHFLAKAGGLEYGELSWFFQGREQELKSIVSWLRGGSGMLVVSGRAGAGKSAVLGNILVHSLPQLRNALVRRGLLADSPAEALPPSHVFDAVIHLSGLTITQAVHEIARRAGASYLPSDGERGAGVLTDVDWLIARLAARRVTFTLLVDALDESIDPIMMARSLLARLATVPGVRLIVGTRSSTRESPDNDTTNDDILSALAGGRLAFDAAIIIVGRDRTAIHRYVRRRLASARDDGAFQVDPDASRRIQQWRDPDIERVADLISDRPQEFLYARLAVRELIESPLLLAPGRAIALTRLLNGNHRDLFRRALERLGELDDRYPILLHALSLARGHGIPEADGIWAAIASSLAEPTLQSSELPINTFTGQGWTEAIAGLLGRAGTYIVVDTMTADSGFSDKGLERTVYRLAHHTFTEYFTGMEASVEIDERVCRSLLTMAADVCDSENGRISIYLAQFLSRHVADCDLWEAATNYPRIFDHLNPRLMAADGMRSLLGRRTPPPAVAGVMGAWQHLEGANPSDRQGLRQLAMTRHADYQTVKEEVADWGVAAGQLGRSTVHARLAGHNAPVNRVRALSAPDGRTFVVSGGDDGTLRLWHPEALAEMGPALSIDCGNIEDVWPFEAPDGTALVAIGGSDGTIHVWDVFSGIEALPRLGGHIGRVWAVCVTRWPSTESQSGLAVVAADDETIRVWDPYTGHLLRQRKVGRLQTVWGLQPVSMDAADPSELIAAAGRDGVVRIWDMHSERLVGKPMRGHTRGVRALCAIPAWTGQPGRSIADLLVSCSDDGSLRLWDPETYRQVGPPMLGHIGRVWGVCAMPRPDGNPMAPQYLASVGHDGTTRLWDPAIGKQVHGSLTGHIGRAIGVCAIRVTDESSPSKKILLATAGHS